jgi:hypothetical protein
VLFDAFTLLILPLYRSIWVFSFMHAFISYSLGSFIPLSFGVGNLLECTCRLMLPTVQAIHARDAAACQASLAFH